MNQEKLLRYALRGAELELKEMDNALMELPAKGQSRECQDANGRFIRARIKQLREDIHEMRNLCGR